MTWLFTLKDAFVAFYRGEGNLRASALTYQSTLAFIPTIILVLLGAGSGDTLELIVRLIEHLNVRFELNLPIEMALPILHHLYSLNFNSLGLMGVIPLLVIFFSSMVQLEGAFHAMWGIENRRTWRKRLSIYLPFILVPSSLIAVGVGFAQSTIEALFNFVDDGIPFAGQLRFGGFFALFFLLIQIGLILFFVLIPRTKVKFKAAFWSSFITAMFSCLMAFLSIKFQSLLFERYSALYGSLAAFPIFLLFMYVQWNLILFGCALCAQIQYQK